LLAVALLGFGIAGYGQTETGQIAGTVYDATGAVIPNARISVKAAATGLERQTTSTSGGAYAVTNLQPGRYTVSAEAPGFAQIQQTAVVVVGSKIGLDFKLQVGGVAATVEITEAAAPLINVETQTLSQTVTGQELVMLPTITRNPYDLVQTVGNVSDGD